jgi:hypothetical protein
MYTIKVRIASSYGKELIYPVCEKAELFAKIARAKSLTRNDIDHIKALGFDVEVVPEVTFL